MAVFDPGAVVFATNDEARFPPPAPDMLLTLFVTVALWQGWRLTRGRPRAWLGFYGATGLAFWTKGPAGLLPLLLLVLWALVEDRRRRLASLRLPRGLALLAAIVAPWPLIGLLGQPSGLQAALLDRPVAGFARARRSRGACTRGWAARLP